MAKTKKPEGSDLASGTRELKTQALVLGYAETVRMNSDRDLGRLYAPTHDPLQVTPRSDFLTKGKSDEDILDYVLATPVDILDQQNELSLEDVWDAAMRSLERTTETLDSIVQKNEEWRREFDAGMRKIELQNTRNEILIEELLGER